MAVADAAGAGAELRDTFSGFRADTPWLFLEIDRVSAQVLGVSVSEIVSALQVYFGSLYVNDFNRFGRTWQVNVQARADYRRRVEDLKRIRVRNPRMPEGVEHMVPLGGVLIPAGYRAVSSVLSEPADEPDLPALGHATLWMFVAYWLSGLLVRHPIVDTVVLLGLFSVKPELERGPRAHVTHRTPASSASGAKQASRQPEASGASAP